MATKYAAVISAIFLTGCSYQTTPLESPAYNVVSSYGEKVKGKWLLYVDAAPLDRPIKTAGIACSAYKFPITMANVFTTSTRATIGNLVEAVELVSSPANAEQVAANGARGLIVVRGEELRPRLDVQQGFWSASMDATVVIIASVSVDGRSGRLLGSSVEGQGRANAEAGFACSGGAKSLEDAAGQSMTDTLRKIGESISNSERVRAG